MKTYEKEIKASTSDLAGISTNKFQTVDTKGR